MLVEDSRSRPRTSGGLGDDEWPAFDPTNDQWQDDRYLIVAWGRDCGDVPPVEGVILTEAEHSKLVVSELVVSVVT